MGRLLVLFFLFVFSSSCGDGPPKGIIPKDTMVPLLTDLHLADGYVSSIYGDSTLYKSKMVYKALFKQYSTDSAAIRESLAYYTKHPAELELIYKEVESNLLKLEGQEQKRVLRERKAAERKLKREEAARKKKEKIASYLKKMKAGKYDFTLSEFLSDKGAYVKTWKKYRMKKKAKPVKPDSLKSKSLKVDSLKADSLKKDLLKKKKGR